MKRLLLMMICLVYLLSCVDKEGGEGPSGQTVLQEEGTIVGNGGGETALNLSSKVIRTYVHYNQIFKKYDAAIEDYKNALSYWQSCVSTYADNSCGGQPLAPEAPAFESELISRSFLKSLSLTLKRVQVVAVDRRLCPNQFPNCTEGESVVAVNIPAEQTIYVNNQRWWAMPEEERTKIALHEYFGIMKIEDSNYFHSSIIAPIIFYNYFYVDFTIDRLRDLLDDLGLVIRSYNANLPHLEQKSFILTTFDCLFLVSSRFPNRLRSLWVDMNSYTLVHNNTRLSIDYYYGGYYLRLGSISSLQGCYNLVVAQGLK